MNILVTGLPPHNYVNSRYQASKAGYFNEKVLGTNRSWRLFRSLSDVQQAKGEGDYLETRRTTVGAFTGAMRRTILRISLNHHTTRDLDEQVSSLQICYYR